MICLVFSVLFFLKKIKRMLPEEQILDNKPQQRNGLLDYIDYPEIALWKRGTLLAIGNIFTLTFIAFFVLLFLKISGNPDAELASDYVCYALLILALVSPVFMDIPKLGKLLKRWEPYVVGLAIGIAVICFDNAYLRLVNLFYPSSTSGNEEAVRQTIDAFPVAAFFIIGFIGPMCEELTYRSGLFGLLRRWHRVPAYIISGIIFGLIHFKYTSPNIGLEFLYLPSYILPGVLFSVAYDLYGLPCSYIAHITNNLYAVTGYLILKGLQ